MAGKPGPLGVGIHGLPQNLNDGTLIRGLSPLPGPIGMSTPTIAGRTGTWDATLKNLERVEALKDALDIGAQRAGEAIWRETGQALEGLIKGLLPGLLAMLVTLVATTIIGGAVGAVIGFFIGGAGAAPGAAIGADLGLAAGTAVLTWLGLGFLVAGIGQGLGEMIGAVTHATMRAWDAPDCMSPRSQIEAAGDEYAHAIALLFKIILMAIVARLTMGQAKASTQETLALLRKSRLGEGFAEWVAKNQEALLREPKLRAQPKVKQSEAPVKQAETPSQAQARARKEEATKAEKALEQKKVPCFHPYDKKKFASLTKDQQKDYLKEMADQLKRQQDQINDMTAAQYKAARDAFDKYGRNPMAEGAQTEYRERFAESVAESIKESFQSGGMGDVQAKREAAARTKEVMAKLAALHEPDMVAGGWLHPDPKGMGRADVNSSIGGSWNQGERVQTMDSAAEDAIKAGKGDQKMNVKLEPCRGKDMR